MISNVSKPVGTPHKTEFVASQEIKRNGKKQIGALCGLVQREWMLVALDIAADGCCILGKCILSLGVHVGKL
jgi:hypothetical protein